MHDYLANRLYGLPERDVERYLSQLAQLCIQRPGGSLERVVIDLCAQSLRVAVKVRCACWARLARCAAVAGGWQLSQLLCREGSSQ